MPDRNKRPRHGFVFSNTPIYRKIWGANPNTNGPADVKATALLKLIYLEMFGHDMSWASFHVLEVMSSAKYVQKRVGYLGAVQSFRPDTEVLMLATNLLKKDLSSPSPTTMSLPILTLPHITTPSLSLSLLPDLLPRLSHSQTAIRKKTIVTLYRLALVYPETLRAAWPKIKERLMDENEDSSVTAAIVNVVCELGWRRPQDFLPLAPRLFYLLVDGGNNWMAIKIIKLFATLTPLEPRLVKKLLTPLMSIIRTTPAMSLLYECINGIIQGGILDSIDGTSEGEEIASLCVGKLRGMIVVEGDPNLKYVALLAFSKIVASHPHLVALQQDVILDCVDDADITIRLRALDLVVGMVSSDNLMSVVGRLMRQLCNSPTSSSLDCPSGDRVPHLGMEPMADSDDEKAEESLKPGGNKSDQPPPLPDDYRFSAIQRILEMCSREMYANITDFEWYIDVLVQLVRLAPATGTGTFSQGIQYGLPDGEDGGKDYDISKNIGSELRNVAVRVRDVRLQATRAAETLVAAEQRDGVHFSAGNGGRGVLASAVWIVGEYASLLLDRSRTLSSLLNISTLTLPAETLSIYLQAVPKIFSSLVGTDQTSWTPERKTMTALLTARVIHFLEQLAAHPSLEVQERAVEFLELMRLAAEAISSQQTSSINEGFDAPLLLSEAIPTLFDGFELNPVAPGAQKKVPLPTGLDLDTSINQNLPDLLRFAEFDSIVGNAHDDFGAYYNDKPVSQAGEPAINSLNESTSEIQSYQQGGDESYHDPTISARRRAERRERNKDDPFYIGDSDFTSGTSTPLHNIQKNINGGDLDIDTIPIMKLDLGSNGLNVASEVPRKPVGNRRSGKAVYDIGADENIILEGESLDREYLEESDAGPDDMAWPKRSRGKKTLLQVDSSGLGTLSLTGNDDSTNEGLTELRRLKQEEEQMSRAMKEVERLRLEMQRASERIQAAKGVPPEGTLVKKKKKRPKVTDTSGDPKTTKKPIKKGKDGQQKTVPKKKAPNQEFEESSTSRPS
ncbi:MAG: AP-3 complex subunit delta [Trichoglossum hirsutum]|nr:MAG: AP-3 complex subunit delta [Trichoglossum hirsutum]